MVSQKRIIMGVTGVALLGVMAYLWWDTFKESPVVSSVPAKEPGPSDSSKTVPDKITSDKPVAPATTPKPADEVLKGGPEAIINKQLIARYNGNGIYDTTMKKVGVTKQGENLGKAFKATLTSNGSYMIKYTDAKGNFRVINSISVNVI